MKIRPLPIAFASQFLHTTSSSTPHTLSIEYLDAIQDSHPINASHSYQLIAQLPLKHFIYKYDAVPGRRHIGVVGPEILNLLPDGVQMFSERSILTTTKEKISLKNFPVVDKESIFMHNTAATQELIQQVEYLQSMISHLENDISIDRILRSSLQAHLRKETSAQLAERRKIIQAEALNIEKNLQAIQMQSKAEKDAIRLKWEMAQQLEKIKAEDGQRRLIDENLLRREQNEHLVSLQEASQIRVEERRQEMDFKWRQDENAIDLEKAQMQRNTSLEKAKIDVDGRIRQQRLNRDIEMQQLQERLEADRVKILQALESIFHNLGRGASALLTDPKKWTQLLGGCLLFAFGLYSSREGVRIAGAIIEKRLGKPSLIRETSRVSGMCAFLRAIIPQKVSGKVRLTDVVLHANLETRILETARSIKNAIRHRAPYRHLLLYGPPGTGKTMVAKRLAKCSGMEYAILCGGDVGPLGADGVTELHALFRWAKASPRGVLIFIDEAEAFLGCRATRGTHMSEAMRNALNALLFHTGTQSRHFMLVIATNRPEDLDSAVTDRIDDTLHFALPRESERIRLLEMYFKEYVGHLPDALLTFPQLKQFGKCTEGMSGREIAKMMLSLQSVVFAQERVHVSREILSRVIAEKRDEHARKVHFSKVSRKEAR
uniref:Uncharacterized protein AlNc14C103G6115 n=1 Tax=Albugo laibachii Nc14 TaxID=890382 RepID=F0WHQ8_9STRA|nr:conserved hypothetical protein [Albugo laibachii Nc14]CCA23711.1 conserved hypothetical protein [Albugo laibachii Nc14]|eukprot:CCA23711.1 conserved hypothetical protein [Albugo laibachii Nc14]